jgi:hypothetical protein
MSCNTLALFCVVPNFIHRRRLGMQSIKDLVCKVYKYGAKTIVKEFATLLSITL